MKILISGASGLIGTALHAALERDGHTVVKLVRRESKNGDEIFVSLEEEEPANTKQLNGFDAVFHLAGESIAAKRWSNKQKLKIIRSRVRNTRVLSAALASLSQKPKVLIAASAIGYYGNSGDDVVTEKSPAGSGFLPDTCVAWEDSSLPASIAGIRVVRPRFGIVLSKRGGALKQMLIPFRLGLGGPLGPGTQYMSWISIQDCVSALLHCLTHTELSGPVNLVSPNPVTNAEFTKTLAAALHRPAFFPVPEFALKIVFGEDMAEELLLSSTRVKPAKLLESKFVFAQPELRSAIERAVRDS